MATKPNITLPNGQVISGSDPNYAEYASQMGGTMASTTPNQITPTIPTPAPTITPTPEPVKTGFTADQIKGLDIAFQRQKEGKATADDEKNLAYATSKGWKPSVVVPGTLPQKDFSEALDPQKSAEISQTANNLTQFSDKQIQELNRAYQKTLNGTATDTDIKNLEYAKSKGYDPTAMTDQTGTPKEEIKEITTADRIYDLLSNMGELRAEAKKQAMKEQDLEGKSQELAEAQSFANLLRTKIQNEGILDIKEQDVVRSKPILTSQISGQLNELSREQKLDAMILQNNYNNALVEVQIAQGNYDRAREIVKEISQDYYDNLEFQLDALYFKQGIEDKEYERMRQDLEYERGLAMEGYVHIKGASGLEGLTEKDIYRDPLTGKIYMKPEPKVVSTMEINGVTYGFDEYGNKIATYGTTLTLNDQMTLLEGGYRIGADGKIEVDTSSANASQIANAIKTIESNGNYDASGASGEFGAYQFMPSTWDSWSKEYARANNFSLMPSGLAKTPENQDAVAMFKINQWLAQGLTPEQIAAKWNSGSEVGWENKIGVNSKGVAYNVPAYVNKFSSTLRRQLGANKGEVSAMTELQAATIVTTISPRLANNKELITQVAQLMASGVPMDDIEDELRYLSQSEIFEPWRNLANTAFSGVKMAVSERSRQLDIVDDYIASGDNAGAVEHIKTTILGAVSATEKKNVTGRDDALTSIYEIERLLDEYTSMGGNTGLLTGKVEDFNKKVLKRTGNSELAYIANEIAMAIQKYRQDLTGAAFTESEAKEYNSLFPSIGKSPKLNKALIDSLKSQYERNQRKFWERQLGGSANYEKLEELGGVPIVGVGDISRFSASSPIPIANNYLTSLGY